MKKVLSILLITVIFTVGAFAYTEQYWTAEDVEDILFDVSHVVFDTNGGGPSVGATYAQENFSVFGGMHGFNLNLTGKDVSVTLDNAGKDVTDLYMGGTLAGSYRSKNFSIGALFNMRGFDEYNQLGIGLGGAFYQNKFRFALPIYLTFRGGEPIFRVASAYIKYKAGVGSLDYLRVRTSYNGDVKDGAKKTLGFDLDANFYNDIGERFGAETLVRIKYNTELETGAADPSQEIALYVEPYIFGYNDGNTVQIGIVPFITIGGDLERKTWGTIGDTGIEIRTEFQPVKNLRARVSVQATNNAGWSAKWNCRAAWYY